MFFIITNMIIIFDIISFDHIFNLIRKIFI